MQMRFHLGKVDLWNCHLCRVDSAVVATRLRLGVVLLLQLGDFQLNHAMYRAILGHVSERQKF